MSIRITTEVNAGATTIRLEGRLSHRHLPDLRTEWEAARGPVSLDLSGLLSADPDGVQELVELAAAGAEITNATVYVRQLLGKSM